MSKRRDKAIALRARGMSWAQIGQQLGINRQSARGLVLYVPHRQMAGKSPRCPCGRYTVTYACHLRHKC